MIPEELQKLIDEDGADLYWHDDVEEIEDKIVDTTRWAVLKRSVIKYKDKFYAIDYDEGATEYQESSGNVTVYEVRPVEKTIISYVPC